MNYKQLYVITLSIYFLCLPLNAISLAGFGSALKVLSVLPICFGILSWRNFKSNGMIRCYFIFTILSFVSLIWSIAPGNTFDRSITYLLLFLLLVSTGSFRLEKKDLSFLKKSLVWSSRLSALLILLFGVYSEGRLLLIGVMNEDPNYFCVYLTFGAIFAIQRLISEKKRFAKVVSIIEICIYLFINLLTGSRGGLLANIAGLVAFLLFYNRKQTFKLFAKKILIILACVVAYVLLISLLNPEIASRFTIENVLSDGGTGRMGIWNQGLESFANANLFNKIFGYGSATVRQMFKNNGYSVTNVMHNIFLETLVELGILGLLVYVLLIANLVIMSFKKSDRYSFAVLVAMIVLSLSTSLYSFKPYINIMIFISLQAKFATKSKLNVKKLVRRFENNGLILGDSIVN